jgi:hypothetical protein
MGQGYDKPVPHPRRLGEVAEEIIKLFAEERISGAQFFKRKHAMVRFEVAGWEIEHHFPTSPHSPTFYAKMHIRQLKMKIAMARDAKQDGPLRKFPTQHDFERRNAGV